MEPANSSPHPRPCAAGCGFYAAASGSFCSVCARSRGGGATVPSATSSADEAASSPASTLSTPAAVASPAPLSVTPPPLITAGEASSASASAVLCAPVLSSTASPPWSMASSGPAAAAAAAISASLSTALPPLPASEAVSSGSGTAAAMDVDVASLPSSTGASAAPRNRCSTCKKKTGLTGFECRCGQIFCGLHRYADAHACTFDYASHGKLLIAKANVKVAGEKMEKL